MKRNTIVRIAFVVATLSVAPLAASAVSIELKSAAYTTTVVHGELGTSVPFESRTNSAAQPLSDYFRGPNDPLWEECRAEANLFQITTRASAEPSGVYRRHSEAYAGSQFTFAPAQDTLAALELNFAMLGQYSWGGNEITLRDLTTGTTLWTYYDNGMLGGNIPWNFFEQSLEAGVTAQLQLPTQLFATHDYQFSMTSWGSSSVPDMDERHVQLSGLELAYSSVPEPTVGALTLLAAAGMFLRRKRS